MTLKQALSQLNFENKEYFKYKFPDVRYDKRIAPKTEIELLRITGRKTMNAFYEWEKSPEYATLVALYLQTKIANDIYNIYEVVREKALLGDEKQIKLLLSLNKEINNMVKVSSIVSTDEEKEDDSLEV